MTIPVGVDGCKGGWLAVARQPSGVLEAVICAELADISARWPDAMIVVDTPIGLPTDSTQQRATDKIARKLLQDGNLDAHRGVGSRVFPAPPRDALELWRQGLTYHEINAQMRGKKISQQAFHILNKIDAADRHISPDQQHTIREGHPELAFLEAAGKTLPPKKLQAARTLRANLLRDMGLYTDGLPDTLGKRTNRWGMDDLLDACILVHVAQRCLAGSAARIPETPDTDQTGLRAEIWF